MLVGDGEHDVHRMRKRCGNADSGGYFEIATVAYIVLIDIVLAVTQVEMESQVENSVIVPHRNRSGDIVARNRWCQDEFELTGVDGALGRRGSEQVLRGGADARWTANSAVGPIRAHVRVQAFVVRFIVLDIAMHVAYAARPTGAVGLPDELHCCRVITRVTVCGGKKNIVRVGA